MERRAERGGKLGGSGEYLVQECFPPSALHPSCVLGRETTFFNLRRNRYASSVRVLGLRYRTKAARETPSGAGLVSTCTRQGLSSPYRRHRLRSASVHHAAA